MPILTSKLRKDILAFVDKYAGDDIVIAAGLRTMNNLGDSEELRTFIRDYKPPTHPEDYVGMKAEKPERTVSTGAGDIVTEREPESPHPMPVLIGLEDLGPVPKKLGANGQAIEKLMRKKPDHEFSVDGLHAELKIPTAKIKPMLALLLERDIIKRVTNYTYSIK